MLCRLADRTYRRRFFSSLVSDCALAGVTAGGSADTGGQKERALISDDDCVGNIGEAISDSGGLGCERNHDRSNECQNGPAQTKSSIYPLEMCPIRDKGANGMFKMQNVVIRP